MVKNCEKTKKKNFDNVCVLDRVCPKKKQKNRKKKSEKKQANKTKIDNGNYMPIGKQIQKYFPWRSIHSLSQKIPKAIKSGDYPKNKYGIKKTIKEYLAFEKENPSLNTKYQALLNKVTEHTKTQKQMLENSNNNSNNNNNKAIVKRKQQELKMPEKDDGDKSNNSSDSDYEWMHGNDFKKSGRYGNNNNNSGCDNNKHTFVNTKAIVKKWPHWTEEYNLEICKQLRKESQDAEQSLCVCVCVCV